jgi:RNA polymerase sigma-70 factor (ECF subfamily)
VNSEELKVTLRAIREGDESAFEELYKEMQTPVYTIIFRITWDKSLSEDILQELFVKLYLKPPDLGIKNLRAYIFQMARNLAIDGVRKKTPHLSLDEISETVHQPVDDFLLRIDVETALKSLPMQECQIVTLRIIGELKFREISEAMKMPLGTVMWQYRKAILKLKKMITGGES